MNIRDRVIASELKTATMEVPQWGGAVGVREMTVAQRVSFASEWGKRQAVALVRVLTDCTFDPDTGKAIFERADQDVLVEKGGGAVSAVTDRIFTLSGYTAEAAAELEKNSKASVD